MQKITNLTKPPKVGELYLVPCIVWKSERIIIPINNRDEETLWLDLENIYNPHGYKVFEEYEVPIIDHAHNDVENGQPESHYHIDTRFRAITNETVYSIRFPLPLSKDQRLEYRIKQCISLKVEFETSVKLIRKSKMKHNCIHKGKCPHRGYDLSQVVSENGIITCPLHGLKFNEKTKVRLN
jgi:Rieske [2Fe-2S] domain